MSSLGRTGEELVAKEYLKLGFKLLERNYKFASIKQVGEIDLIFQKDKEIIFVEVKARSSEKFGDAFEAVDFFKQKKLIKTAKLYLQHHPIFQDYNYRIDVAAVDIDNKDKPVTILKNAIEDLE